MLKKKENIQNYLSTLNSQNVFLTKSPCEKLTGNSFLEQLFQLYFSQVGPQQKIACQCEVGDKTAVLGGQCGWATLPTTSKQSKIQKQKSTTWWEDDALWLNNAQAFPSNTVACLCAPKKEKRPCRHCLQFLIGKHNRTCRQECAKEMVSCSNSAPYHSDKIPAHVYR